MPIATTPKDSSFKTFLALGDSYTIGQSVDSSKRFPAQTVAWLKANAGFTFKPITYVATTGFTCMDLLAAITQKNIKDTFSMVTLLIGVNDQYRGYDIKDYPKNFTTLLQKAIGFANNNPSHVFVLSIPDWGVTPFAKGRDVQKIAMEIDAYNTINKQLTEQFLCNYTYITASTRVAATDLSLLATDGLHPSGKEYAIWANLLGPLAKSKL